MTHLRKMMLEELQRRNYAQSTVEAYTRALRDFAKYFQQPPDQLGPEQTGERTRRLLPRQCGTLAEERPAGQASRRALARTRSAILMRLIYWNPEQIYVPFSYCWDTLTLRTPRSTCIYWTVRLTPCLTFWR